MDPCSNCFIHDEYKLESKMSYFESRNTLVIFLINAIMNIQKYFVEHCKCDGDTVCLSCSITEIFNEDLTYDIFANCFNFYFLSKIKENLCLQLLNLKESQQHFLCMILNNRYKYHHKCFFTGKLYDIEVKKLVCKWEKIETQKIIDLKPIVVVQDIFK